MLKAQARSFSTARALLARAVPAQKGRIHPLLAAKQFVSDNISDKLARKLRRKETKMKKKITRDVNILKQYDIKNVPFKVDPVLGDPRNEFFQRIMAKVENQEANLAYGTDRLEMEKLLYAAEKLSLEKNLHNDELREAAKDIEENKKRAILTILNLRNTNTPDKKKLAVQYAKQELQREPGDTGSPEAQAAVMTIKIHFGMAHVKANKKDHTARQLVRELVQKRQRILKYLKKQNPERYYYALAKLGLTDDVIVREFSMSMQYLQDYKVWGDKVLVKETATMKRKELKIKSLRDKVHEYHELARRNHEMLKAGAASAKKSANKK
ncbi:mitochondrial 37S ribosomal protein uS15m [Lodderomyces beijingensis]|uniref:37S ribosomal protein S28, mitochondrial n=1 Tax=Lodderomyces beijingensis TaxID=1775926 RepID=A0ABP0ZFR1_9ASCO